MRKEKPQTGRVCAYCGSLGPLTKEHVFPDWLARRRGDKVSFSVAIPGRGIRSALQIGDVCSGCNNGPLSRLDAYAKEMIEPVLDCDREKQPRISDDGRLTRWVLKSAYNGQRSPPGPLSDDLKRLVPFILNTKKPPPMELRLYAGVMGSLDVEISGEEISRDLGNDLIGVQECFLPQIRFAPLVCVGPLVLQVLGWSRVAVQKPRHQIEALIRSEYQLRRIDHRSDVELQRFPGDPLEWVQTVTMDKPGVEVEPRRNQRRKKS